MVYYDLFSVEKLFLIFVVYNIFICMVCTYIIYQRIYTVFNICVLFHHSLCMFYVCFLNLVTKHLKSITVRRYMHHTKKNHVTISTPNINNNRKTLTSFLVIRCLANLTTAKFPLPIVRSMS